MYPELHYVLISPHLRITALIACPNLMKWSIVQH
uniref:Uncharacterized protein n=1 Tax=Anguilla anguilla TaxID=7936 RepID=A0A0E9TGQ0_ANGAN